MLALQLSGSGSGSGSGVEVNLNANKQLGGGSGSVLLYAHRSIVKARCPQLLGTGLLAAATGRQEPVDAEDTLNPRTMRYDLDEHLTQMLTGLCTCTSSSGSGASGGYDGQQVTLAGDSPEDRIRRVMQRFFLFLYCEVPVLSDLSLDDLFLLHVVACYYRQENLFILTLRQVKLQHLNI